MELIKPGTRIDFMGKRRKAIFMSIALIVISIGSLIYHKGPNWGVEFTGGTEIHIKLAKDLSIKDIKNTLDATGYPPEVVQQLGLYGDREYLIRFSPDLIKFDQIQDFQSELEKIMATNESFKGGSIQRVDYIGPRIGKELIRKAIVSILLGCVGILIYVMIRFELGFAMGAVIALIHDTVITLGAISLMDKEFTLALVAGLLTVIGYSVNDTIIIYDRIRENMKKSGKLGIKEVVNEGVNQTLTRTILTSFTVFLVLIPLFIFGGSVIHDFAFTLIVGAIVGTYSSIFIASAFVVYWKERKSS
ncbi:MAG: protein translocase subunit SecF [Candidatus Dadabacteria bacterium]|nr:protein translocase subunit SecF [Candidatus Dadabacteria bacterium]TDI91193.1 MAG: protein translocase subunit SecF [Candidatus Dadabacteria bacterium]TDJ00809.1 MAG: protein translocase subunit SecF [Candidatus Dadabacteria bacterium]